MCQALHWHPLPTREVGCLSPISEVGIEASKGQVTPQSCSQRGACEGGCLPPVWASWGRGSVSPMRGVCRGLLGGLSCAHPCPCGSETSRENRVAVSSGGGSGCWAGLCPSISESGSRGGWRRKPCSMQMCPQHLLVLGAPGGGQSASGGA